MQELKIYNNDEFGNVRTIIIDGEPWFVGKDVAMALGYKDTQDALKKHVTEEDKRILKPGETQTLKISNYGVYIINESGLYALIFGSKLESAKRFKRWVTSEVLPSLRKEGTYSHNEVEYHVDSATLKGAASAGCLIERAMKAQGSKPYEVTKVLDALFRQSGIILPDCFVKIPQYEQMELPLDLRGGSIA